MLSPEGIHLGKSGFSNFLQSILEVGFNLVIEKLCLFIFQLHLNTNSSNYFTRLTKLFILSD